MRFQIPKRHYVDRGRDEGKSKPVGFRLPKSLVTNLNDTADDYGYSHSFFLTLILDAYLSQNPKLETIKLPKVVEKDDLKAVSYRLDGALCSVVKTSAKLAGITEGQLVAIAISAFLKSI
jgi:hypothetical protein